MEQLKSQATVRYAYMVGNASIRSISTSNVNCVDVRDVILYSKKFVNQNYFKPGETLSYTIMIANNGNYQASNIVINDDLTHQELLNNSLEVFSLKNNQILFKHNIDNNSLIIEVTSLSPDDVLVINYQAKTNIEDSIYNIANCAIIYADEVTPFETTAINLETKYASLVVSKAAATDYTYYNSDLTYTIDIFNDGNLEAVDVQLSDQLPKTFALNEEKAILLNGKEITDYFFNDETKVLVINLDTINPQEKYQLKINGKIVK